MEDRGLVFDKRALALKLLTNMFDSRTLQERARAVKSFYQFLVGELRDTTFEYEDLKTILGNVMLIISSEIGINPTQKHINNVVLRTISTLIEQKGISEKDALKYTYTSIDLFYCVNLMVAMYSRGNAEIWTNIMRGVLDLIASKFDLV